MASRRGDAKLAWILVTPSIIGFLVFAAYPTLAGLFYSFTDFRVFSPPDWIGLENYAHLLQDDIFWHSAGITVYYVLLTVVLTMVFAVTTAVILHRLTASTVLRGIILLPFLISTIVTGVVWTMLLDPQLGIINILLRGLGFPTTFFLSDSHWVIPVLALISVWKSAGYTAILVFAGLQTIPPSVYEAARVDGAGEFQMFWRITLPLLRPIIALVLVLTVISAFQVFDIVAVSTQGGPADASLVLQMYIYDKAFGQFDFGYASTMAIALFVMLIILSFVQMRLLRASESDQG